MRLNSNLLKRESQFPIALWAPWTSALLVLKPDILGAHFSGADPRGVWAPNVGHQLLAPPGQAPSRWDLSLLCVLTPGVGFWWDHVSVPPAHPNVVFYPLLQKSSSPSLQIFFRGKWFICCRLVCPWGGEYGISLHHHLCKSLLPLTRKFLNIQNSIVSFLGTWYIDSSLRYLRIIVLLIHEKKKNFSGAWVAQSV